MITTTIRKAGDGWQLTVSCYQHGESRVFCTDRPYAERLAKEIKDHPDKWYDNNKWARNDKCYCMDALNVRCPHH